MDVLLLTNTPAPERTIAVAARLCYAPLGAAELMSEMSDEQVDKVLTTIMNSGHFSALEHASFTFAVAGVSRALTHQLVRHRIASFNQQSQRYVAYHEQPSFVRPPSLGEDEDLQALFATAIDTAYAAYTALLEAGVAAEDARYVLPSACASNIVITMNIRELLHFFTLRCCRRTQWELRELADHMLALAAPHAPSLLRDAGAPCRRGTCPEGKMTCGQPFERVTRTEGRQPR